jgi:hypothetical protein
MQALAKVVEAEIGLTKIRFSSFTWAVIKFYLILFINFNSPFQYLAFTSLVIPLCSDGRIICHLLCDYCGNENSAKFNKGKN